MSETIKEETAEAVQAEPQGLTLEKFEEATEVVSKVIRKISMLNVQRKRKREQERDSKLRAQILILQGQSWHLRER